MSMAKNVERAAEEAGLRNHEQARLEILEVEQQMRRKDAEEEMAQGQFNRLSDDKKDQLRSDKLRDPLHQRRLLGLQRDQRRAEI